MKKCPYCAEEIQDEAIVCRYCGRELAQPVTVPPPAPASQPVVRPLQPKKPMGILIKIVLGVAGLCIGFICIIAIMRLAGPTVTAQQPTETAKASNVVMPIAPTATRTPKPTNTPRPTAAPRFGTLDNPYPYGEAAPLTFTYQGQASEFTFQVLNVIRGDDARNIVMGANSFNDEAPAGATWMMVQVRVTLTSGAAYALKSHDVAVISGGQIFDGIDFSVCCTEDLGFPKLDANIALAGTSVEGWVIRPVITTDERPLLVLGMSTYKPDLKDGLFFALHP